MPAPVLRRLAPAACAAALLLAPTVASAADQCVGTSPSCAGSSYPFTAAGLQSALTAAAADSTTADRIVLAAGTLPITSPVNAAGNIEVLGAGKDATTISYSGANSQVLTVGNGLYAPKLHDLALKIVSAQPVNQTVGLSANEATVERVAVIEESASDNVVAAKISGGQLIDSSVTTNSAGDSGVVLSGLTGDIVGSDLSSGAAVRISGGSHTISRTRIRKTNVGITMDSGTVSVRDSLIELGSKSGATGIGIWNWNNGNAALNGSVVRSTVVGTGTNQKGIVFQGDSGTEVATGVVTDTVVALTGAGSVDLSCVQATTGSASLTTSHSAFAAISKSGTCAPTHTARIDSAITPPRFVDSAAGDYRPAVDSPLVDAGISVLDAGETLDVLGAPRKVDGNGAGGAQVDVGAAEFQPVVPVVVPVEEPNPGNGEQAQQGPDPQGAGQDPQQGGGQDPQQGGGQDPQQGGGQDPQQGTDGQPVDPAPSVSLGVKPKSAFKRGTTGFSLAKKASRATLGLKLAGADALELALAKPGKGKSAALKGASRLTVSGPSANLAFGGKFAGKRLAAGSYRLTITPLHGATKGKAITVTIRVAK